MRRLAVMAPRLVITVGILPHHHRQHPAHWTPLPLITAEARPSDTGGAEGVLARTRDVDPTAGRGAGAVAADGAGGGVGGEDCGCEGFGVGLFLFKIHGGLVVDCVGTLLDGAV